MKNIGNKVVENIPPLMEALRAKIKGIDRAIFLLLDSRMDGINVYYNIYIIFYEHCKR